MRYNPKENTIWINTSTPISSWEFSSEQPIASSGKIWICVGTSSIIEFNMLQQNTAKMYPLYVKQYVSDTWVDKTAESYQNGKWVALQNYIYYYGNECSNITGGWSGDGYKLNSNKFNSATNTGSYIDLQAYGGATSNVIGTVNAIDLTLVQSIRIVCNLTNSVVYNNGRYGFYLCVVQSKTPNGVYIARQEFAYVGNYTTEIDTSSLSGYYYIAAYTESIDGIKGQIYSIELIY